MKIRYSLFVFIGIMAFGCNEKPAVTTESEPVADYIQYVNPIVRHGVGIRAELYDTKWCTSPRKGMSHTVRPDDGIDILDIIGD